MSKLKVALIQMISVKDWQENLKHAAFLIKKSASCGANLVVLPEFFIQITDASDGNKFAIAERIGDGIIQSKLSDLARINNIYLLAGTILTKDGLDSKFYNTSILFSPEGELVVHYNKIHLFKFSDDKESYDESEFFNSGSDIVTLHIDDWKIGLGICYDLRFPEFFRTFGEIDAIVLPAAFTYTTGSAHWDILCRARAIENQCYFLAVNQGGKHETGRHTYGHTMVIDPWGKVISECLEGEHIVFADLDKSLINNIRKSLPALEHRKL